MKLAVPYFGAQSESDFRLLRLAEFLGISCETVALERTADYAGFLSGTIPDACLCMVVNPRVFKDWIGQDNLPVELVDLLLSRFSHLVVHGLRVDAFDSALVAALSRGSVKSIEPIGGQNLEYEVAKDSRDICEAFAGISFGPADPKNDHVLSLSGVGPAVRRLISIGGQAFMAEIKLDKADVLFIASEDVADLNNQVGKAPLSEYFSRLVPQAMALRHVAGDECWRPSQPHACIIIDDPLLRKNYGFLNFENLLNLTKKHNFHTAIAFIPHNFRRNSTQITRLFRENSERLSICFHGNDHTGAEFASVDAAHLNTLLSVAETRMSLHEKTTGLKCDRVMVFPQGNFSLEAMKVLTSHNFYAAVNTVQHPAQEVIKLTLGELAQPAVLRYEGFPLFTRRPTRETDLYDIAFSVFWGRPVLIVEHHEIFENPQTLIDLVVRINSVVPEMQWSSLATAVSSSILVRKEGDGTPQVRAFAGNVQITNESNSTQRCSVEWNNSDYGVAIDHVSVDGTPSKDKEIDDQVLRVNVEMAPGCSRDISLVFRNDLGTGMRLGLSWKARAFVRRRLSEFRDNYLSKHQGLLDAAKAMQRRFLRI